MVSAARRSLGSGVPSRWGVRSRSVVALREMVTRAGLGAGLGGAPRRLRSPSLQAYGPMESDASSRLLVRGRAGACRFRCRSLCLRRAGRRRSRSGGPDVWGGCLAMGGPTGHPVGLPGGGERHPPEARLTAFPVGGLAVLRMCVGWRVSTCGSAVSAVHLARFAPLALIHRVEGFVWRASCCALGSSGRASARSVRTTATTTRWGRPVPLSRSSQRGSFAGREGRRKRGGGSRLRDCGDGSGAAAGA